ncbi:hypothetical protein [Dyella subtropica]|uniref:hypothetical protein n=1 Tax=Dyella subtropica TaxID=2992127 RepID=UPI0022563232|nr:hypothetical protein [Dyella subtropica]
MHRKIVLHSIGGYRPEFDALVESWIQAGVAYVGVIGKDAAKLEDVIDELCVGDGENSYFILTASHPNESLLKAVEYAEYLKSEHAGPVQIVEF